MGFRTVLITLLAMSFLASCGGGQTVVQDSAPRSDHVDLDAIPDAVPRHEPPSRYGNPDSYTVLGRTYRTLDSSQGFVQRGMASWYGTKFHGRRTSSGEPYNMYAMTAAHKSLPIPTYVRVTNLDNGKQVTVRVNDRGPFHDDRIIDLSYAAAARLDMLKQGTARVEIRAIDPNQQPTPPRLEYITAQADTQPPPESEPAQQALEPHPTLPATPAPKRLFIQVGAYREVDNAVQIKQQLLTAGLPLVRVHTEQLKDAPLYKVQLGPLKDLETADQLRLDLSKLGLDQVRYVSQ